MIPEKTQQEFLYKCTSCHTSLTQMRNVPLTDITSSCPVCQAQYFISGNDIEPMQVYKNRIEKEQKKKRLNERIKSIGWGILHLLGYGVATVALMLGIYFIAEFRDDKSVTYTKQQEVYVDTISIAPFSNKPVETAKTPSSVHQSIPSPTVQNSCDLEVSEGQLMSKIEELGYQFLEYDVMPTVENNDQCTIMYRCIVKKVDFEGNVEGTYRLMPTFKKLGGEFQVMTILLYSYSTGAITQIY